MNNAPLPPISLSDDPPLHHAATDEVQRNIACPACGYNLRGLRGVIVECPECGHRCDVVKLITQGWTKPWWKAPHVNMMSAPATTIYVGVASMVIAVVMGEVTMWHQRPMMRLLMPAGVGVLMVLAWSYFMRRTWCIFGGWRGPVLAMLLQVVVIGLVSGWIGVIAGCTILLAAMLTAGGDASPPLSTVIIGMTSLPVGAAFVWGCRRGERYVAGECIRRYLSTASLPD